MIALVEVAGAHTAQQQFGFGGHFRCGRAIAADGSGGIDGAFDLHRFALTDEENTRRRRVNICVARRGGRQRLEVRFDARRFGSEFAASVMRRGNHFGFTGLHGIS